MKSTRYDLFDAMTEGLPSEQLMTERKINQPQQYIAPLIYVSRIEQALSTEQAVAFGARSGIPCTQIQFHYV